MTQFWTVVRGGWFMVICIALSVLYTFIGGMMLDRMLEALSAAGLDGGIGTSWDTTGPIAMMINIHYLIPVVLSGIGIGVFALAITHRHRYEQEYDDYGRY